MQQRQTRQQSHVKSQRLFTASEVAEFEYCPLVWWHQQFEPMAAADTEELFARLVELEHEHDSQAPALPEYQMVEQLLVRKGAFDEGRQQHLEHAEEVEEIEEEGYVAVGRRVNVRILGLIAAVILVLAVLLILAAIFLR
ncbi:MAG TPA: hypothetical protein VEL69_01110 [Ktedonobacteraceae bacterium]|nr:hypothetical protein [Ktedonobacteraceae bacterium]